MTDDGTQDFCGAIDVREVPFPRCAMGPGQQDQHAYSVAGFGFSIGVLYARDPFMPGTKLGVHISISHVAAGRPRKVTDACVSVVEKLILQQGLEWPKRYVSLVFGDGPFVGYGVHLWEEPER